mmetsp:Transcript_33749/g.107200  ORF Transcript_33749/g.107200 Transcript_33749/m.107200 type:complete len:217 (-) Transcript_33749:1837-2487(-)
MYSRTSVRPMSSTSWLRPSECGLPIWWRHQSGCAWYSLDLMLIISGSIHRPNLRPRALTSCTSPGRPFGSLERSANQSPRLEVASLRSPNHPSSRTSISHPHAAAALASSMTLSWVTPKYMASHVLIRIGDTSWTNLCGMRYLRYIRWYWWLMLVMPVPDHTITHSGDSKESPEGRCHSNLSGLIPTLIRRRSDSVTSASMRKLPEYTRLNAYTSP